MLEKHSCAQMRKKGKESRKRKFKVEFKIIQNEKHSDNNAEL